MAKPGPQPRYSLNEILEAVAQHGSQRAAARALGLNQSTISEVLKRAGTQSKSSIDARSERSEIERTIREEVKTLPQLIKVCEIDTKEWEVERWICNKWDMGYKDNDGVAYTIPLFQVKVWLKRISGATKTLKEFRAGLLADIKAEVKRERVCHSYPTVKGGWLFEFAPLDLHAGKYTWDEETVTNYDTDIAADLFRASLDFLLNRAMKVADGKIDRVLFVIGNDVSHIDSKKGQTTAGTPMDVDTRYIRVYRRICEIHRHAVDVCRGVAPVDIKVVSGNHDELTAFHLGEILGARYDRDKHVSIDNSPRLRKYYEFGVNLFGFTHGDSEKVKELPLTMAREVPEMWARCPSREWHVGHLHIAEKWEARGRPGLLEQDLFSDKGVRVRRLMTLTAHDAWHTKHAYMDRRACDGFVFHKTAGFTSNLSFNVDHFTGKGLKV